MKMLLILSVFLLANKGLPVVRAWWYCAETSRMPRAPVPKTPRVCNVEEAWQRVATVNATIARQELLADRARAWTTWSNLRMQARLLRFVYFSASSSSCAGIAEPTATHKDAPPACHHCHRMNTEADNGFATARLAGIDRCLATLRQRIALLNAQLARLPAQALVMSHAGVDVSQASLDEAIAAYETQLRCREAQQWHGELKRSLVGAGNAWCAESFVTSVVQHWGHAPLSELRAVADTAVAAVETVGCSALLTAAAVLIDAKNGE